MKTRNFDQVDRLTVNEMASGSGQLSDEMLAGVSGGLVVIAMIMPLMALLMPAVQKERAAAQ